MIKPRFILLAVILAVGPLSTVEAAYGLLPPKSTSHAGAVAQRQPLARATTGWKRQVGTLAPYQSRPSNLIATKTGRLVTYPPNRLTIEGLLARRALNPTRFDYYHPQLGKFLARAQEYRDIGPICGTDPVGIISDTPYHRYLLWRRSLNPDRFDYYHPLLGVILKEHTRIVDSGKVCPPVPPKPPRPPGSGGDNSKPGGGGGTVTPQEVVPEPSSVALLVIGMGATLAFGARRRGRLASRASSS